MSSMIPRLGNRIAKAAFIQAKRFQSTYFEMFPKTFPDKKPTYSIEQNKLKKEYRALQAQFHPDMASTEGTSTTENTQSSTLNKAYHTLKDPLTRAQYMIKLLNGVDLTKDEVKDKIAQSDPELLMEILDIHEELSEMENEEDVRTIAKANKDRIGNIEKKLETAFKEEDFDTAIKLTVELRYWTNLAQAIKEWAPGKPIEVVH